MKERIQLKLQEIAECIYYKVINQDRINNLGLFSGEFCVSRSDSATLFGQTVPL
jgi:hypothetical protein